jgi:quercetin dioxygenase-like cupin family protein
MRTPAEAIPVALHRGDDDLPWIDYGEGVSRKLVCVRPADDLWIVHSRFPGGRFVQTHRHTGPVFAFTLSGRWKYREYDAVNYAGSFLLEPAGSTHTLIALGSSDEIVDVWFAVWGSVEMLDATGGIERVQDRASQLRWYFESCEDQGLERPNIIID